MKKKIVAMLMAATLSVAMLAGCGDSAPAAPASTDTTPKTEVTSTTETVNVADVPEENLTETQKIIKEAQGMSLEELANKAIEESNGKTFYGVGNSSRGKSALPLFIEYLQSINPSYTMEFE